MKLLIMIIILASLLIPIVPCERELNNGATVIEYQSIFYIVKVYTQGR